MNGGELVAPLSVLIELTLSLQIGNYGQPYTIQARYPLKDGNLVFGDNGLDNNCLEISHARASTDSSELYLCEPCLLHLTGHTLTASAVQREGHLMVLVKSSKAHKAGPGQERVEGT
jgi:hypothetical protein